MSKRPHDPSGSTGSGKAKRLCSFRSDYSATWPFITKASRPDYAKCTICDIEFSIGHGGKHACEKHIKSQRHVSLASSVNKTSSMMQFLKPVGSTLDEAVTRAEIMFTGFLVEHNLPIATSDHAGKLFRSMFLQSEHSAADIIRKYSAARTKTTHIVNEMASNETSDLVTIMKSGPYSIATDASNDKNEKLFPLVVRLRKDNEVKTELLVVVELKEKGTGENIASLVMMALVEKGIPFSNCVAFTSDNANVMVGSKSGAYSFLKKENNNLIATGCVCHRFDLALDWAVRQLPVKVENFFLDVYYYMDKSANRVQIFHDFQELCGIPVSSVCKHCPTRWLSLGKSCQWFLTNWEPLKLFFEDQCKEERGEGGESSSAHSRKSNSLANLKSRTMKLYILYISYVVPLFKTANQQMQYESVMIHRQRIMTKLISDFLLMFVKSCAMAQGKPVADVDFTSTYNHQENKDIMVGDAVRQFIEDQKLGKESVDKFYKYVKAFLNTACRYLIKNLPLNEAFIKHAQVADIQLRHAASFDSVRFFVKNYPSFLPDGCNLDHLEHEFRSYQVCALPDSDMDVVMDKQWARLQSLKDDIGENMFQYLPVVMQHILAIPHSNASCERIFSLVRKNRTDFRSSMSVKTLQNLLILKQAGGCCYDLKPSRSLVKACKGATHAAL